MSEAYGIDSNRAIDGNENGTTSTSGGGGSGNHGWQEVTNKKQRRQAAKLSAGVQSVQSRENGKRSSESKVFETLESEAEERRARRKAKLEANAAVTTASDGGELSQSADDDSEGDEYRIKGATAFRSDVLPKKAKAKKPKKPKVSVVEAAAAIDVASLSDFLLGISKSFRDLPDVQLIRCADYFAHAFHTVANEKFAWNKILRESQLAKSIEVPYSSLPEPLIKTTSDWLAEMPADALSQFTMWLLREVLDDPQQKKGSTSPSRPKVGLLVILALLLRRKPDVMLQQAATIRAQFQGGEKLHTLAWAYGQAAQGDLVTGMALWVQNLLPLAVGKASTPVSRDLVLQFIESILFVNTRKSRSILLNGATRKGERLVPPAALDSMLRVSYPYESGKTKATERFQAFYYFVKELALAGSSRSKATKPVAQQILPLSLAAAAEDVLRLQQEAVSYFVWSLAQNPDCFKQWEKLHMENLEASTRILNYINDDWKENATRLRPLDDFRMTLQALSSKHRNALKAAHGDDQLALELKAAEAVTRSLLRKTSRLPAFTTAVATIAVSVAVAYGLYLLSPEVNPWGWDGKILLSKTHNFVGL